MDLASKVKELGFTLPAPAGPAASYVPVARSGNLLFVSGQLPWNNGVLAHPGLTGRDATYEQAHAEAQICALQILARIDEHLQKDWSRFVRIVKCNGYVASAPDFTDQHKVMNGASDLLFAVLGEAGRHARAAVGVACLPLNACVEVEAIVEIKD